MRVGGRASTDPPLTKGNGNVHMCEPARCNVTVLVLSQDLAASKVALYRLETSDVPKRFTLVADSFNGKRKHTSNA